MIDPGLAEQVLTALDAFREPMFVLSGEPRVVFANHALYTFLGVERQQGPHLAIEDFWPSFERSLLNESPLACEFRLSNGACFAAKLAAFKLDAGYVLLRVLSGISRNETLHSFHSHRLETLGLLAGGVAHDFNNVLAGILGHITYLKTILPKTGAHVDSLFAIEDGAKKASALTQQILSFSKMDSTEKVARVHLGELVRATCKLLRGAISPEFMLECSVPDRELRVLAVEGKLAQIVVNLVINARDALAANGVIRVSVTEVTDDVELDDVFGVCELASKSYCRLTVSDNGSGMPKEIQGRIFEPYFSTKKDKGTGLGLALVKEIVELFGGAISLKSEVGRGTDISIYLPLVEPQVAKLGPGRAETLEPGTGSVLVVDDESPVRNVLLVSLQHLGYDVETASNGAEALEKYRQRPGGFDLVILDMIMPQQSGDEVFFELKRFDPNAQVMVVSGFSSESAVRSILDQGGLDFLQKPFTIEELSKRVRGCLQKSAQRRA